MNGDAWCFVSHYKKKRLFLVIKYQNYENNGLISTALQICLFIPLHESSSKLKLPTVNGKLVIDT